jgi:hypothetical protein
MARTLDDLLGERSVDRAAVDDLKAALIRIVDYLAASDVVQTVHEAPQ